MGIMARPAPISLLIRFHARRGKLSITARPMPWMRSVLPGRIAADSRFERLALVQGLQADDVVQDINQFFDLLALVRMPAGGLLQRCDDFQDNPFEGNRVLFIDGFLKTTDGFDMGGLGPWPSL